MRETKASTMRGKNRAPELLILSAFKLPFVVAVSMSTNMRTEDMDFKITMRKVYAITLYRKMMNIELNTMEFASIGHS